MNIFSEIYGEYYRIASKIVSEEKIDEKNIHKIILNQAFRDSMLFIPEKIIPGKNQDSPWGLLKRNDDGTFSSTLKNKPVNIISSLQKRWLKARMADARFKLFVSDETFEELSNELADVKPLFSPDVFCFFDEFSDGDDFSDKNYRKNFQIILEAIKSNSLLKISYKTPKSEITGLYKPVRIEFSRKNNKFRLISVKFNRGQAEENIIINIGRINNIEKSDINYNDKININSDRCPEPVRVIVSTQRNAVERFMMEFASFEKKTEFDAEKNKYIVDIWYNKRDETELLIMLLGFGPVIKIAGPEEFKEKAIERIKKQYSLLFKK